MTVSVMDPLNFAGLCIILYLPNIEKGKRKTVTSQIEPLKLFICRN